MVEQKRKVLLIEDDVDMSEAVRLRLESNGYEVVVAHDGLEGFDMARTQKPDLIILDVMLPKMDGFTVCRMLKYDESYKNIPVIMFTARVQKTDIQHGTEVGANAYVTKPFKAEELLAQINTLIKDQKNGH
jgi:DNA-binding response OmpR family regulator